MLRWLWLLVPLSLPAQADDLVLRTAQQSGSLVKYDPDGDPNRPGLCREILQAVQRTDPGLQFTGMEQQVPLKRVERLLADGLVDAFFCLLKSPEREKQWRYVPIPLYTIRHVIVQRADDARNLDTLPELAESSKRKPVLVTRGTALARRLVQAEVAVAEVGSEREALQMLLMNRADVIYGYDVAGVHYTGDTAASGTRVSSNLESVARKMAEKYPAGTEIDVHYNPDNPAESVINPGGRALLLLWLMPVAVLTLAYFAGR